MLLRLEWGTLEHQDEQHMCHHATTAGEQQTDDIILEVRERKWWRNDLEASF